MSDPSESHGRLADDALRAAFADGAGLGGAAGADADADATEAIWRAVRGECSAEELGALLRRVREEPELAEVWRVAQAIHAEVVAPEATAAADRTAVPAPQGKVLRGPARWWRQPAVVGVGAVVAMAAAALLFITPPTDSGSGPMRADTVRLASTLDSTDLPRDHAVLRWTPSADGAVYAITVTTDELAPVARVGGLHEASWQVPAESLAELAAGTVLLWRVEAQHPGGTTHRSPTFEVVLR